MREVLDVAAKLIQTKGVDSVTMESLAAGSQVNKAVLYRYWRNRESVLVSLFDREMQDLDRKAQLAGGAAESFEQLVAAIVRVTFEHIGRRGVVPALLRSSSIKGELEEHRRRVWRRIHEAWSKAVADRFGVPYDRAHATVVVLIAGWDGLFDLFFDQVYPQEFLVDVYTRLCVTAVEGLRIPTPSLPARRRRRPG